MQDKHECDDKLVAQGRRLADWIRRLSSGDLEADGREVLETLIEQHLQMEEDEVFAVAFRELSREPAALRDMSWLLSFQSQTSMVMIEANGKVENKTALLFGVPMVMIKDEDADFPVAIQDETLKDVGESFVKEHLLREAYPIMLCGVLYPLESVLVPYSMRRRALSNLLHLVNAKDAQAILPLSPGAFDEEEAVALRFLVGAVLFGEDDHVLPFTEYEEGDLHRWMESVGRSLSSLQWTVLVGAPAPFSSALEDGIEAYEADLRKGLMGKMEGGGKDILH